MGAFPEHGCRRESTEGLASAVLSRSSWAYQFLPSEKVREAQGQLVREEGVDRRGNAKLRRRETERGGKVCWDTEKRDRDLSRSFWARIASKPLGPREARVRTLRPGEDRVRGGWRSGGRQQAHVEALVPHELDTGTSMFSAGPILPEQWCRTDAKRLQEQADLARLRGVAAQPLALLPFRTGTTTADAGSLHDAQAPVNFSVVFMRGQFLIYRAPKRSIGLESKILTREATGLPCRPYFWRSIAGGRSEVW